MNRISSGEGTSIMLFVVTTWLAMMPTSGAEILHANSAGLLERGKKAVLSEDLENGILFFQQGIKCHRQMDATLVQLHFHLSEALRNSGQLESARQHAEYAIQASLALGDTLGWHEARCALANILVETQDLRDALEIYLDAVSVFRQAEDWEQVCLLLGNIGALYEKEDRLEAARRIHQQSFSLARELKNASAMAHALLNLGVVQQKLQDDPDRVIETYRKSSEIAMSIPKLLLHAKASANLANVFLANGDTNQALQEIRQALALETTLKDTLGAARSGGILADILVRAGDSKGAYRIYEQIRATFHINDLVEEELETLRRMEMLLLTQNRAQERIELIPLVVNANTTLKARRANFDLLLSDGGHGFVLPRIGDSIVASPLSLLRDQALRCEHSNDWKEAESAWTRCIVALEAKTNGSPNPEADVYLRALESESYKHLIFCLVRTHQMEKAVTMAGRMKAAVLTELIRKTCVAPQSMMSRADQARYDQIQQRLSEALKSRLTKRVNSGSAELSNTEAEIRLALADMTRLEQRGLRRTVVDRIGSATDIPEDARIFGKEFGEPFCLLEYVLTESELIILLRRYNLSSGDKTIATNKAVNFGEIADLIRRHRKELEDSTDSKLGSHRDFGRTLYQLLIQPIEAEMPCSVPIAVIPDGMLWDVSFSSLVDGSDHYLVERNPVFLAPSSNSLRALVERENSRVVKQGQAGYRALIVADPLRDISQYSMGTSDHKVRAIFSPIPGTSKQAQTLEAMWRENVDVIVGTNATKEQLLARIDQYRWIHFATHCEYDGRNPWLTGLVLAPKKETKANPLFPFDLLGPREILLQRLNCEAVILSACNSVNGAIAPGEGPLGLVWSFLAAGSSSCLASYWRAVDHSTAVLMERLYSKYFQLTKEKDNFKKIKALWLAQQSFLDNPHEPQWKHPRFWAAFVWVGDPR